MTVDGNITVMKATTSFPTVLRMAIKIIDRKKMTVLGMSIISNR